MGGNSTLRQAHSKFKKSRLTVANPSAPAFKQTVSTQEQHSLCNTGGLIIDTQPDEASRHTQVILSNKISEKYQKSHNAFDRCPLSDRSHLTSNAVSNKSGNSSATLPYSVHRVRHSRVKIEHDVTQMHNRISLLE
jgi:hypothetical protein